MGKTWRWNEWVFPAMVVALVLSLFGFIVFAVVMTASAEQGPPASASISPSASTSSPEPSKLPTRTPRHEIKERKVVSLPADEVSVAHIVEIVEGFLGSVSDQEVYQSIAIEAEGAVGLFRVNAKTRMESSLIALEAEAWLAFHEKFAGANVSLGNISGFSFIEIQVAHVMRIPEPPEGEPDLRTYGVVPPADVFEVIRILNELNSAIPEEFWANPAHSMTVVVGQGSQYGSDLSLTTEFGARNILDLAGVADVYFEILEAAAGMPLYFHALPVSGRMVHGPISQAELKWSASVFLPLDESSRAPVGPHDMNSSVSAPWWPGFVSFVDIVYGLPGEVTIKADVVGGSLKRKFIAKSNECVSPQYVTNVIERMFAERYELARGVCES